MTPESSREEQSDSNGKSLSSNGPQHAQSSSNSVNQKDMEGIALLRHIFPELSFADLQQLHCQNVEHRGQERKQQESPTLPLLSQPISVLGKRIWKQWLDEEEEKKQTSIVVEEKPSCPWRPVELPHDFLRLPESIAVRRFLDDSTEEEGRGRCYYLLLDRLEQSVLERHEEYYSDGNNDDESAPHNVYTRVLHRTNGGLGMTLCQQANKIWVHSILGKDDVRWYKPPPEGEEGGPALQAGIVPGDWVMGINGQALLPPPPCGSRNGSDDNNNNNNKTLLLHAVSAIQYSQDPIVVHLRHVPVDSLHPLVDKLNKGSVMKDGSNGAGNTSISSLLDLTNESVDLHENEPKTCAEKRTKPLKPRIHPFVLKLAEKGVMKTPAEQSKCTHQLNRFTQRARQWESFSSFRLDAATYDLVAHFDAKDLPQSFTTDLFAADNSQVDAGLPYAPSTPMLDPEFDYIPSEYLSVPDNGVNDGFKSDDISAGDTTKESNNLLNGKPVDLDARELSKSRSAMKSNRLRQAFPGRRKAHGQQLQPQESNIFIPLVGVRKALCIRIVNSFMDDQQTAYTIWAYDVESGREWYAPVRYLEDFSSLRTSALFLCPSLAQLPFPQPNKSWSVFGGVRNGGQEPPAIRDSKCRQLEHFLRKLASILYCGKLHPMITEVCIHLQSFLGCHVVDNELHLDGQTMLNEAYRKTGFGVEFAENGSRLQQRVRTLLKRAVQRYVHRLFLLEQLQRIKNDFVDSMRAQGPTLAQIEVIEAQGRTKMKERAMNDLEKVRSFLDQTQSLILDGCHDDLRSMFHRRDYAALHAVIDDDMLNTIFTQAVREQVEIEVYVPLRGIVSRLVVNGWRHDDTELHFKIAELRKRPMAGIPTECDWSSAARILSNGVGMSTLPCCKLRAIVDCAKEVFHIYKQHHDGIELGADDFLPIFIHCVVQAELERPCALLLLLRTLCDFKNRTNQVGYYLATFEAAITHIQELNLAETS